MNEWRLIRVEISAGYDAGVEIDECEFLISGVNQTNSAILVATSSTHESSHYPGLESYKLFTGTSEYWASDFSGTWPQWFQWDFGESTRKDIDQFSLTIRSASRAPKTFSVKYSNDGVTWVTGDTFTNVTWTNNETKTFSITSPTVVEPDPDYVAPTIKSVDAVHNTSTANKISFNLPSLADDGDVLVVCLGASWTASSVTPPAGWSTIQVNNSFPVCGIFYRIIDDIGTEPAVFDFSLNDTVRSSGVIYCLSGVDITAPIAGSGTTGVATGTITIPPLKSANPDYLLLALAINGDLSSGTFSGPYGMSVDQNVNNTTYLFSVASLESTIAQTGFKSFTSASGRSVSMNALIKGVGGEPPPENAGSRVTQLPVLLAELNDRVSRVTQLPILVPYIEYRPSRVTQVPVTTVQLNKAVPLPLPLVPEVPFTEIWDWYTVVNISNNGREQRAALRTAPRIEMKLSSIILNEQDRVDAYNMLLKYCDKGFSYPLYVYYSQLTQKAHAGDTKLYFDPQYANLRDGERAALYDLAFETTTYVDVLSVDNDGCTLATPLLYTQRAGLVISPAPSFKSKSLTSLEMSAIDGSMSMDLVSLDTRPMLAVGQTPELTTYDGYVILDKRPLADGAVGESFDRNTEWVDNSINRPIEFNSWNIPFVSGTRSFLAHRPSGIDYWRAFSDHTKGRCKPFLVPTFRNDLPLAETPLLNATVLVTSNAQFLTFWTSQAYRYLRIERNNRSVIYRRIVDVNAVYDAEGNPTTLSITLNASIGGTVGDNQIVCVSYMNLCRLDDDAITLVHEDVDTTVSLVIRTVER